MRDRDVREALRSYVKRRYRGDPNSLLIEELGLCQGASRIDLALINGTLNGFEIKSERDTLERLPEQADYYNSIFDTVTIVTGTGHLEPIQEAVPDWWGIQEACDRGERVALRWIRQPRPNPGIDPRSLIQLIWRDEALSVLEDLGLAAGLRSKPRRELWDALVDNLTKFEINKLVRTTLKTRQGWSSGPRLQLGDV